MILLQDGVDKNSSESIVGAAKAIAQELTERQLTENGKIENSDSINDDSTNLPTQRHPRYFFRLELKNVKILTFGKYR